MRPGGETDHGSASVELALVLPVVMLLVVGAIFMGRAYNVKIEMTGAAREAARYMVLNPTDQSGARQRARDASPGLGLTDAEIAISANCSAGTTVTVTITRSVAINIPFGPDANFPVRGVGAMQC